MNGTRFTTTLLVTVVMIALLWATGTVFAQDDEICPTEAGFLREVDPDCDDLAGSPEDGGDACPFEAGPISNRGCPIREGGSGSSGGSRGASSPERAPDDRDGDGTVDSLDQCPDIGGHAANGGCPLPPDSDGDGTPDDRDECPEQGGPNWNAGCQPDEPVGDSIPQPEQVQLMQAPESPDGSCVLTTRTMERVNVREEPSTASLRVGTLIPGTVYVVLSQREMDDGQWFQLENGWVAGWVTVRSNTCDDLNVEMETANTARVRIMHLALDAPAMTFVAERASTGEALEPSEPVPPGAITDYLEVAADTYVVNVFLEGTQTLVIAPLELGLDAGHSYTLVVVGQAETVTLDLLVIDETAELQNGELETESARIIVHNLAGAPLVALVENDLLVVEALAYGDYAVGAGATESTSGLVVRDANQPDSVLIEIPVEPPDDATPILELIGLLGTYPGTPSAPGRIGEAGDYGVVSVQTILEEGGSS